MKNVYAFKWYLPFVIKVSQICYQSCCLSDNALYSISPLHVYTGEIKANQRCQYSVQCNTKARHWSQSLAHSIYLYNHRLFSLGSPSYTVLPSSQPNGWVAIFQTFSPPYFWLKSLSILSMCLSYHSPLTLSAITILHDPCEVSKFIWTCHLGMDWNIILFW
jgi:hypothetical protein